MCIRTRQGSPAIFIAIDVGTGSVKASAVDTLGRVVAESRRAHATFTPHVGWAEQDPNEWADHAVDVLAELVGKLPDGAAVSAIGLTGQSPTVAPVTRAGVVLGPGLLYRDNRAASQAADLIRMFGSDSMHRTTGQVPSAFHIAPKLLWMRAHQRELFDSAELFLQPRDLVLHRLTGVTATDETHANSTLLFDLTDRSWSSELFAAMNLSPELFPPVSPSATVVGGVTSAIADATGLPRDCPVVLGAADSQSAAYGSGVITPGPVSEMAGTSSCINSALLDPVPDISVAQYAHVFADRFTSELGINTTGGAVQWAVENLGFTDYSALAAAAGIVHDRFRDELGGSSRAAAPLFLPFLADGDRGDSTLRAGFLGLSDRHGRSEMAYAVLEGIAFSVRSTLDVLRAAEVPVTELRVAGGGASLDRLGQIKADALDLDVLHMTTDTAAVGAALLAAHAVGRADEAAAAIASGLDSSGRHSPDHIGAPRLNDRFGWFGDVLASSAIRAAETSKE